MSNMNYYELTIKYERAGEKGLNTKVTEQYLVRTHSCATAEIGILKLLASQITGEARVTSIKESLIKEFCAGQVWLVTELNGEAQQLLGNKGANTECDRFYKAKVIFPTIDEVTCKVKKLSRFYCIHSGTVEAAHDLLIMSLSKICQDFEIHSVVETKITDYAFIVEKQKDDGVQSNP